MAGGIWTAQNKVRPGAYIRLKAISKMQSGMGERGVVALPVPLSWGEDVTEITAEEFATGKGVEKIGLNYADDAALPIRLALQHCAKAIIVRTDKGGAPATAELENLSATAVHTGVFGNNLAVSVKQSRDVYQVSTLLNGKVVDVQYGENVSDLHENKYVIFSGEGTLIENAGTKLAGGKNGTITEDEITGTILEKIAPKNWDVLAFPFEKQALKEQVATFITNQRVNHGRARQAVLVDHASANSVGIISVTQGFKTQYDEVSPSNFVYYVAGMQAGSSITKSNTYEVIKDATEIINPYDDDEIEDKILNGEYVLSVRSDGAVVVEKDINTLHEFDQDNIYAYSKNRVVHTLDGITDWIANRFAVNYIGKVNNDENGRAIFKADIISYMENLAGMGAIKNFDPSEDVQVLPGEEIDGVYAELQVQPADSMEKLYMVVTVKA